jgi:hypothetical protein
MKIDFSAQSGIIHCHIHCHIAARQRPGSKHSGPRCRTRLDPAYKEAAFSSQASSRILDSAIDLAPSSRKRKTKIREYGNAAFYCSA